MINICVSIKIGEQKIMQTEERLELIKNNKLTTLYSTLLLPLTEENRNVLDNLALNNMVELEHIYDFLCTEFRTKFNEEFETYVKNLSKEAETK